MRLYIILLQLLYSSLVFAGTIDPNVKDDKYIEYGKKHTCILRLIGTDKDNKNILGSCVVIKPNIILTAAHLAQRAKESKVIIEDTKNSSVISYIYPTEYLEDTWNGNGYDIAVGIIETDIEIEYYPQLYDKYDEVGKIVSVGGYGVTGTFDTGLGISDGQRRAGSNIIQQIEEDILVCSVKDQPTSLEFLIAPGDSGGGLFIEQKLAGINSIIFTYGGIPPKSDRNTFSGHTRISKHKDWIEKTIKELENANIGRATRNDGQ
jgi:V8-like Glu-specific endopeptidase